MSLINVKSGADRGLDMSQANLDIMHAWWKSDGVKTRYTLENTNSTDYFFQITRSDSVSVLPYTAALNRGYYDAAKFKVDIIESKPWVVSIDYYGGGDQITSLPILSVEKTKISQSSTNLYFWDFSNGFTTAAITAGDDIINGGKYNDKLYGYSGNDTISGGIGNDIIDGGEGIDYAVFSMSKSTYTIFRDEEGVITIDSNEEGSDKIINIENLKFLDAELTTQKAMESIDTLTNVTTDEDTTKYGYLNGPTSGNITFLKLTDPTSGTVTINTASGAYTYTPKANYNGSDSFTFKVNDGTVDSAVATVSITVAAVNDVPVATAVSITTDEDTAKTGTLAGTDVEGSSLTFTKVADPANGTVTINSTTGAYTYTPKANYNGSDSFTFKVNDGTVDSAVATVSITVAAVNDVPAAKSASISVTQNTPKSGVLLASDVDGDTLTFSKVSDPSNGTVAINSTTGAFTYTPKTTYTGTDSFTFKVNDGAINSAAATVSIEIQAVAPPSIKFWNNPTKTPSSTGISSAIDLSDAIAILKMIVGLNVNANGVPLSPYQALAADFNQNGDVGLDDAIGVLKKIVGLSSPEPTWKYFDENKIKSTLTSADTLSPKNWVGNAEISGSLAAGQDVSVVGVLTGDVNGSWG